MEEQVLRHQDPQEQEVEEMEQLEKKEQEVKEMKKQPEKITLQELAGSLGLTPKTARRLLRKWREKTKRDEIEPPYSRWEWDPSDSEEARALEEATIWLETQVQLLRSGKSQE